MSAVVPSFRAAPVYDRPGIRGTGRGAGETTPQSTYTEPIVETIRYLLAFALPPADREALVSTYGTGDAEPTYDRPLTSNDVMAVRARGKGTIELSTGDDEAETATPSLTIGKATIYIDVFGTPATAERLRHAVDNVLFRVRVDAAHPIPTWAGDASAVTNLAKPVPNWHHIAQDTQAGIDEQWAGELYCSWQLRTP